MIRGDHIHGAIPQPLDQRLYILLRTKRRVHLPVSQISRDVRIRQGKVMGTGFRSHPVTPFLGQTHHFHRIPGGAMTQMKPYALLCSHKDVSGNDHIFHCVGDPPVAQLFLLCSGVHHASVHQILILAMGHDQSVHSCDLLQTFTIKQCVHHALPVLREGNGTGLLHGRNIHQLLICLTHGYGGKLLHPYRRLGCLIQDIPQSLHRIHRRLRIRHGADSGHTAGSRCSRAGQDIFLLGLSGIPEMYMQVDESGEHVHSRCIDHLLLCITFLYLLGSAFPIAYHSDPAIADHQRSRSFDPL